MVCKNKGIKGTIYQENIIVVDAHTHTYAFNIRAPKYIQLLTDLKAEIDSNTIIVGDFMAKSSRQKNQQGNWALNETLDQMDWIDLYRTFHPNAAEYTVFSSARGTFSRVGHMLRHKTNLSKFKKTEIISSISSDHNGTV